MPQTAPVEKWRSIDDLPALATAQQKTEVVKKTSALSLLHQWAECRQVLEEERKGDEEARQKVERENQYERRNRKRKKKKKKGRGWGELRQTVKNKGREKKKVAEIWSDS